MTNASTSKLVQPSRHGLEVRGVATKAELHWNLGTAPLIEAAVEAGEGLLSEDGAFVVETGQHTGRSANDKFIVKDDVTAPAIWWGKRRSRCRQPRLGKAGAWCRAR